MMRTVSIGGLIVLALAAGCILAPQPDPPGAGDIDISALDEPGYVAVVGRPGAVPPRVRVRVERTEGSGAAETDASDVGSFVVVIWANPGETLNITYRTCDDRSCESDPLGGRVDLDDGSLDNDPGQSPCTPGGYSAGCGTLPPLFVDPPDAGMARVWGEPGSVQDNVRVVVTNATTGFVRDTVHGTGRFEVGIPAEVGHRLVIFAVRPEDPGQASGIVELVVPAP